MTPPLPDQERSRLRLRETCAVRRASVVALLVLPIALGGCVPTSYDPADAAKRCGPHGGLLRVQSHDGGGWTTDGEGFCKDGTTIVYEGWNTKVVAP